MKRLPILFIDAVPGCESRNIEFMTENAYALVADTASGVVNLVDTCLSGAVDPMEMVRRRENDFPFNAVKTIYDTGARSTAALTPSVRTRWRSPFPILRAACRTQRKT